MEHLLEGIALRPWQVTYLRREAILWVNVPMSKKSSSFYQMFLQGTF